MFLNIFLTTFAILTTVCSAYLAYYHISEMVEDYGVEDTIVAFLQYTTFCYIIYVFMKVWDAGTIWYNNRKND